MATLFLLPVPLGPCDTNGVLPLDVVAHIHRLRHFVVENAKTARSVLKTLQHPVLLRDIAMWELNEHTKSGDLPEILQALRDGHDLGLMSEAGCPAVADPGSALVELAHREGFQVKPLVGPSSILLALMASGMNGQRFSFHGYLPAREPDRSNMLRQLEADSKRHRGVEIFIETPYRNHAMLAATMQLRPDTRLCVACDISLQSEWIRSATIATWKKQLAEASLDRRPAVFLLQSA